MKILIFSIFIVAMVFSKCGTSPSLKTDNLIDSLFIIDLEESINDGEPTQLSCIGSDLKYITLETKPACLLDGISKLTLTDSFIFVTDSRKILKFDRDGMFQKQIGAFGRGPGEHLFISDFYLDEQSERLFILTLRSVLIYDFDGLYQKSIKLDFLACQLIMQNKGSIVFHILNLYVKWIVQPEIVAVDTVYSLYITDTLGRTLTKIRHPLRKNNEPYINTLASPLYTFNKEVHFLETGIDTLFIVNNNLKLPYAIFNLKDLKMDPCNPILSTKGEERTNKLRQKLWINSLNEDEKYLYLTLRIGGFSDSSKYCLFNKLTYEVTYLENNGFANDLDGGTYIWPQTIKDGNTLITWIDALKLKTHVASGPFKNSTPKYPEKKKELEKLANSLKETDNPVLIIVSLKE